VQDVRANFVCVHNGELAATVFSTPWKPWQVLIHFPEGTSILKRERFEDPKPQCRGQRKSSTARRAVSFFTALNPGDLQTHLLISRSAAGIGVRHERICRQFEGGC
jgi:hypothetical protein